MDMRRCGLLGRGTTMCKGLERRVRHCITGNLIMTRIYGGGARKGDAEMHTGSEYGDLLIQKFSLTAM